MSTITRADLKPIALRSAKIALVVGPILTLINQWEAVVALETPNLAKLGLTFLVPFCVSFFSGYTMRKSLAAQICAVNSKVNDLNAEVATCSEQRLKVEDELARLHSVPRRPAQG